MYLKKTTWGNTVFLRLIADFGQTNTDPQILKKKKIRQNNVNTFDCYFRIHILFLFFHSFIST